MALAVPAFLATVGLEPAAEVVVEANEDDLCAWASLEQLVDRVDRFGFGTGPQLLTATIRTFVDVAASVGSPLPGGFHLTYRTTIPRQVGLAGSSALVISALRCFTEYAGIDVPDALLASIALRVETEQLGISAGLQDRVVQCLGGLVSMDFSSMETDARLGVAHGHYESIDRSLLPPLFLVYGKAAAEPSGVFHTGLRARFDAGEPFVRETMRSLAGLVTEGRASLQWRDHRRFGQLMARNMELRRDLGPLPERQVELVELAGSLDAPATFAGSGGAVVGVYRDAEHLTALSGAFGHLGAELLVLTESDES